MTISAALALAGAAVWAAEPAQTLEMADGSVYMGHTSSKDYKKKMTQFRYDSAFVVSPREGLTLSRNEMKYEKLPEAWQNWFAVHPQYVRTDANGNRSVNLHRLVDKNGVASTVFLFSRSPKEVKYYTLSAGTVNLSDNDVKVYKYGKRDELDLTGLVTEIRTTDGQTVRGQLVQESSEGKGILTDNCVVEVVPIDKIASIRLTGLDPESGIENQVEFLELINVASEKNERSSYTGIITEFNYRTGGKPDQYVIIYDPNEPNSSGSKVYFDRLLTKSKSPNSFYAPLRDVRVTNDTTLIVNGVELIPTKFEQVDDKEEFKVSADSLTFESVKPVDGKVVLSARNNSFNQKFILISIKKLKVDAAKKKGKNKKDKEESHYIYRFRYSDLLNNDIVGNRKVSRNGVANITYTGLPDGTYLLFNQTNKKTYLFSIGDNKTK